MPGNTRRLAQGVGRAALRGAIRSAVWYVTGRPIIGLTVTGATGVGGTQRLDLMSALRTALDRPVLGGVTIIGVRGKLLWELPAGETTDRLNARLSVGLIYARDNITQSAFPVLEDTTDQLPFQQTQTLSFPAATATMNSMPIQHPEATVHVRSRFSKRLRPQDTCWLFVQSASGPSVGYNIRGEIQVFAKIA